MRLSDPAGAAIYYSAETRSRSRSLRKVRTAAGRQKPRPWSGTRSRSRTSGRSTRTEGRGASSDAPPPGHPSGRDMKALTASNRPDRVPLDVGGRKLVFVRVADDRYAAEVDGNGLPIRTTRETSEG